MKKKSSLILMSLVVSSMFLMSGCKKTTPVSLVEDATKKMDEATSVSYELMMKMAAEISEPTMGLSMDMKLDFNFECEQLIKSGETHIEGTADVEAMGQSESLSMEMFNVIEDGEYVSYINSEDIWMTEEWEKNDDMMSGTGDIFDMIRDGKIEAELEEETQTVDGVETYVVNTMVDGDLIADFMKNLDAEDFDADLDDAKMKCKIYFDKEDGALRKIAIDIEDLFETMLAESLGEESLEIDMSECAFEVLVTDYDSIDEIKAPKEAREDTAEDTDDSNSILDQFAGGLDEDKEGLQLYEEDADTEDIDDQTPTDENGNYVIKDYDEKAATAIAVPEGYTYSFGSTNYTAFSDDDCFDVTYSYETYTTDEEILEFYSDMSYYEGDEDYENIVVSEQKSTLVNGMDVKFIRVDYLFDGDCYCVDYYAWTPVGNGTFLLAEIEYFGYEQPATHGDEIVKTMFENVKTGTDL